ncbi:MAG: hypothetical protein V4738_04300 [Pseudomonadota bacterium]
MSTLRDARLQKALEHAPDAALAPGKSVGDAIKFEALRALQPVAVRPSPGRWARLKAWWLPPGHVPWNAAFASLLLASLVTLVWRGEDTPGAEPEALAERPVAAAPAAPSAPPPAQAQVVPPPLADAPRARPAAPVTKPRPTAPAPADTMAADVAPAVPAAPSPPAEVVAAVPQAPVLRAAPAPAAKAMAPSLGRTESAGAAASQAAHAPWDGWTALRVTAAARTDRVLRSASPGWAGVVQRLVAVAVTPAPLEGVATLEVELLRGGVSLGRLELAEPWVRWTPTGEASRTGQADAALLRELRVLVTAEPVTPPDSAR